MRCPYCFYSDTSVLDSRDNDDLSSIRRRRECLQCSKRFTTYERVETVPLLIVKKDGRREAFDRNKLTSGILKACEKRPVSLGDIKKAVDEIEAEIRRQDSIEVQSAKMGEMVMGKIKKLDKVAYVRFASVYKAFEDVESFAKEAQTLLKDMR